jgi:hypothetical protein
MWNLQSRSSRVDPHPRRAVVVYHYSGLPGDAKELLAKYYDAMFYIANWGTTRLMFRFPKSLIDIKKMEPYCVEHYITCETIGDYVVLDMSWDDEEWYGDWVEGEGYCERRSPHYPVLIAMTGCCAWDKEKRRICLCFFSAICWQVKIQN